MIYQPVCQKCESQDLLFDYNTDVYTCNDCGVRMTRQQWKKIVLDDINNTFIETLPSRRQQMFKDATKTP